MSDNLYQKKMVLKNVKKKFPVSKNSMGFLCVLPSGSGTFCRENAKELFLTGFVVAEFGFF